MGSFGQTEAMGGSTLVISFILVCCYLTMAEGRRPNKPSKPKPFRPWQQAGKPNQCSKRCRERCDKDDMDCQKRKSNKPSRRNCQNTKCIERPCVCPLSDDPVCDKNGNKYPNMECAECEGVKEEEIQNCPEGSGMIGMIGEGGTLFL